MPHIPRNHQSTTALAVSLPVPLRAATEDSGRLAAARARAGLGLSRAYDNADEFIADLHTAARGLKPTRRSR